MDKDKKLTGESGKLMVRRKRSTVDADVNDSRLSSQASILEKPRPMPTDPKDLARAMFRGVERKIAAKKLGEDKHK